MKTSEFLLNRDETGREIVTFPETGKKYYVEYIEPRAHKVYWGDIDPASNTMTGNYGSKLKGAIKVEDSLITESNGFTNIYEGEGSPYSKIVELHNKYKESLK